MKHKIFIIIGAALIVIATAVLIFWQWGIQESQEQAEIYVDEIRNVLPEIRDAAVEERRDNTMPVLSVEGTDFVGILEMPRYQSVLPVCASWGENYPSKFDGSIYDRTIKIGATTQAGQYDFYREISAGDSVFFTDMGGNRYAYTVADIRYEDNADMETLERKDADLTLFIKNIYSFEYIILFCKTA